MPLTKSKGNMYDWCTHTHSHLAGACSHTCSYCYVQAMAKRFPAMKARYSGPVRLIEKELSVDYGSGKTIFIEHMNDLFSIENTDWIAKILNHCAKYPDNEYVFQTKNPEAARLYSFDGIKTVFGTTIESNRYFPNITKAPSPLGRFIAIGQWARRCRTFITIEPIMDFDVQDFVELIVAAEPSFINIGADSKRCGLPEPSPAKVKEFIAALQAAGIIIRKKANLERLA